MAVWFAPNQIWLCFTLCAIIVKAILVVFKAVAGHRDRRSTTRDVELDFVLFFLSVCCKKKKKFTEVSMKLLAWFLAWGEITEARPSVTSVLLNRLSHFLDGCSTSKTVKVIDEKFEECTHDQCRLSQWTEISSSWIEIQTVCERPLHATPPHPNPQPTQPIFRPL